MTTPEDQGGAQGPALGAFGSLAVPLPSLDWTLDRLCGVWAADGEMISCPLPGHDDSTPSFNLWAADGDGVPTRFGCFGCGRRGTVLDLIALVEGLPERAALTRAGELALQEDLDDVPRERARATVREARDLEPVLHRLTESVDVRRLTALQRYMDAKGFGGGDLLGYAMNEWEWTAGEFGAAVIPHRDRAGTLTGIKYRTIDRKWNEVPSRFDALYGAWLDAEPLRPRVLICEGETDALWAAWQLREDPTIRVLSLPSGASQVIRDEWREQLADREITLAFDSDDAGMAAARRWCAERPDALLARLPEGEDLLSCGVPVVELIDRARVPMSSSGAIMPLPVFGRVKSNGTEPLANFSLEPIKELWTDDGPAWDVRITGERRIALIRAQDMGSPSSMTRWANRNGRAWFGGGATPQGVLDWLQSASAFLPLERAVSKAGRIGRSFVGPGFCVGPDRMRYIPPALGDAKLADRLSVQAGRWDPRAIVALERVNDPTVTGAVLGWLCATLLRGRRAPAPPLFVTGESGSGKTSLIQRMLGSFGFGVEMNLTTTTPYGVDCMVNSSVGFPVWFDEYRGGAREDSMMRLRQLLRDAYNGQPSVKGGMTQQATELTEVTTWAGIVVSGEMGTQETSLRDRLVMLDLDRSARDEGAFKWLGDRTRTAGLGWALLEFLAKRPDALFRVNRAGPSDLPDRFRDTLGFVLAGLAAWHEFRWEQGMRDAPPAIDLDALASLRRESPDPWLEAIKACQGVRARSGEDTIVEDLGDGWSVLIPAEVIVEAKRVGIELPARTNEFVSWLRRHYVAEECRLPVTRRRAWRVRGLEL